MKDHFGPTSAARTTSMLIMGHVANVRLCLDLFPFVANVSLETGRKRSSNNSIYKSTRLIKYFIDFGTPEAFELSSIPLAHAQWTRMIAKIPPIGRIVRL